MICIIFCSAKKVPSYPCISKADVMKIQEGLIVVTVENLPRNISKDTLQQFNSALQNPKFKEEAKLQGITIEVGICVQMQDDWS